MIRSFRAHALIVFLVSWLGLPPSLWAQPRLVIPPMGSVENEKARQYLADAFSRTEQIQVVPLEKVDQYLLQSGSPEGAQELRNQAARDFKEGEKAFKDVDLDRAVKFWRKAKSTLESIAITSSDFKMLRLVKYSLALAFFGQGEALSARNELRELLVIDPNRANEERRLSQKKVPPSFVEEFEETRKEVLQLPEAKLVVDSGPRGALVMVDGKASGLTTEAEIFDLPIGRHFVVLKKDGYKTLNKSILLNEGVNRMLENLEKDRAHLAGREFQPIPKSEDLSPHQIARLDEISRALKGDLLLFMEPGRGQVKAQLFDFRTTELSPVEIGRSPEETVQKLLRYLDESGYVDPKIKHPAQPTKPDLRAQPDQRTTPVGSLKDSMQREVPKRTLSEGKPWYENYWIWAGIGVALGAGAVGVWLLSNSSSGNSNLTVTFP